MYDANTAVSIIKCYVDEYLPCPSFTWSKAEFQKRSYQRWAVYEICDRILDSPLTDPLITIEKFILETTIYACYSEDEHRNFIFQNAVETAEKLSLLFA